MIFGKKNFFENWPNSAEIPCGSKISLEIALSSMVFEIQAFLCFAISRKIRKILGGRHFLPEIFCLNQLGMASAYPAIKNFIEIALTKGFRDKTFSVL